MAGSSPYSTRNPPLWYLPIDILNMITKRIEGAYIVRLLITGDKQLMMKLSNGGITSVVLVDGIVDTTSRYPRALSSLHQLKSLSIDRGTKRLDDVSILRRQLQKLSPTLETLILTCAEAEEVLLSEDWDQLSYMYGMDECDENGLFEKPSGRQSRLWNISKTFPHLKTLEVSAHHSALVNEDAQDLPSTLTKLSVAYTNTWTSGVIEFLPKGIVDLTLGYKVVLNPKTASLLSRDVKSLAIFGSPDEDTVSALPRGLLNMGSFVPRNQETLKSCPPALQRLDIVFDIHLIHSDLLYLPKNLIRLTLDRNKNINIDSWVFGVLPRSLTHFTTVSVVNITGIRSEQWPPRLRILECTGHVNMNPLDLVTFPQSLRSLTIGAMNVMQKPPKNDPNWDLLFSDWPQMPPITRIRIHGADGQDGGIGRHLDKIIPHASVTDLHIGCHMRVNPRYWRNLPPRLLKLRYDSDGNVQDSVFDEDDVPFLPKGLEELRLCISGGDGLSPDCFKYLPRTLVSLEAYTSKRPVMVEPRHAQSLPDGLQHLILSNSDFDAAGVQSLPRRLQTLSINKASNWTGEELKDLPRRLTRLNISDYINTLRDRHLEYLPRTLVYLELKGGTFTEEGAKFIPKATETCYLPVVGELVAAERMKARNSPLTSPDLRVLARYSNMD